MIGLFNGSLYEVLQNATSGKGKARVSAVGFNVSCGHVSATINHVTAMPDTTHAPGLVMTVNGAPG